MGITRENIRGAAREILRVLEEEGIGNGNDLVQIVGREYPAGEDRIRVIATPNAPGMTPDTFAFVYVLSSKEAVLRAGFNNKLKSIGMGLCLGKYFEEMGYRFYSLDAFGNNAHKKNIPVENGDYIKAMREELELLKDLEG